VGEGQCLVVRVGCISKGQVGTEKVRIGIWDEPEKEVFPAFSSMFGQPRGLRFGLWKLRGTKKLFLQPTSCSSGLRSAVILVKPSTDSFLNLGG
jgi:hypothetical protein